MEIFLNIQGNPKKTARERKLEFLCRYFRAVKKVGVGAKIRILWIFNIPGCKFTAFQVFPAKFD